jgi:DNA polymerase
MPILFHDFETQSTLDLKRVGAYRYSKHPTTQVWCCAFAIDDGPVKLWVPGDPVPPEFIEAAGNPDWTTSAFNDQFERLITQNIMAPRHGWPVIPIERRRCLMAASLALALPGKLENVAKALNLDQQKDKPGRDLMLRLAKPRKPRPDEDPDGVYWIDDPERLERGYAYARQDVEVERELHHRLRPLIPEEQGLWALDSVINERGFAVDRDLAAAMVKITDAARAEIDAELSLITGGQVTAVAQAGRLVAWLAEHGCPVDDIRKSTISHALRRKGLAPEVIRVLELRRAGAHAAAAKPQAFLDRCSDDGRLRGAFTYHGASTGRWSSLGVQVQNLKRPDGVNSIAQKIEAVATGDIEIARKHGQPLETIGAIVRALVVAAPSFRFVAADFSGVESRITAWLAGETWKIEQWAEFDRTKNTNNEPYLIVGHMLGAPADKARALGKIADLAFGYMGGPAAWRAACKLYGADEDRDEDEIRALQQAWRRKHPNVTRLWALLNRAAILATRSPGQTVQAGPRVSFRHEDGFLFMRLPSGRDHAYPHASLMTTDRGDLAVTFSDVQHGKFGPCRHGHGSYGGTWIENAVQAVARDLFACAMRRCEASNYSICFHVHDELVSEVPVESNHSVEEFERIITELPAWADGMAIAAKGCNGPRFCETNKGEAPAATATASSGRPWDDRLDDLFTDGEDNTTEPEAPPADDGVDERPASSTAGANGDAQTSEKAPAGGYDLRKRSGGRREASYFYQLLNGDLYLRVDRIRLPDGDKYFIQFHWEAGRWVKGGPEGLKIPYRLRELVNAPSDAIPFIVEGEACADAVAALELVATTNPGGGIPGAWTADLAKWFQGRGTVCICEDNDDTGRNHTREIITTLKGVVPNIYVLAFPELPEHGDVKDWLDQGHTKEELLARAKATPKVLSSLTCLDLRRWDHEPVPGQEWSVHERYPLQQTVILSGEGGEGKSLTNLHLCAAHPAGRDWLGMKLRQGPAIFIDCEDSQRVLQYRTMAVAQHLGTTCTALADAGLRIVSLLGEDAVLGAPSRRTGIIEPTSRYRELLEMAGDIKPVTISIASSADVFAGNENDRTQVKQFINLLTRVAIIASGTVILISHPSLAGISSGSGLSGSTQWHNAVRARAVMKKVKSEEGEPEDQNLRQIEFRKNQYGPITAAVFLRWNESAGLFLPIEGMNLDQTAIEARADVVFLELLRRFTSENRIVSDKKGQSYAPFLFAHEREALSAGVSNKMLVGAMRRLFAAGMIWNEPYGRSSRPNYRIAIKT